MVALTVRLPRLSTVVASYRKRVERFGKAAFRPDDVPEAARELAALCGGAVRVYDGKDGPVADLRISAGTLIAVGLGARVPAEISNGSGGVSWISHTPEFVDVDLR